jgi:hypothetical protein
MSKNDHYSGVVTETQVRTPRASLHARSNHTHLSTPPPPPSPPQSYVAYLWAESSWDVPLFHAQHVMNLIKRLLFAALSVFANFGILYFHWTTPPHPKFTVLRKSRVSIRLHLISGTVNVLLPIVAFCDSNKTRVVAICWVTYFVDFGTCCISQIQAHCFSPSLTTRPSLKGDTTYITSMLSILFAHTVHPYSRLKTDTFGYLSQRTSPR